MSAQDTLASLWRLAGLPGAALEFAQLTGADPVFPSSFAVGLAAQTTIAGTALAACELGHMRVHANFAHYRDGALRLLGLDPATATRDDAQRAMLNWRAVDFETAASDARLVATALRSFAEWDATPQGQAIAAQPLFTIERVGDAPPLRLPALREDQRPLEGVRVLDLTRILAGPVGGQARHHALPGNLGLGIWRIGGRAAQRAAGAHSRAADAAPSMPPGSHPPVWA